MYLQGCNFHCEGCHNPETWDYDNGYIIQAKELAKIIIELIPKNNVKRGFSILGGEPFGRNVSVTSYLCREVKKAYPDIKINIWTGFLIDYLLDEHNPDYETNRDVILNTAMVVDGPYIKDKRDITLLFRGSSNQRIFYPQTDSYFEKFKKI